MLEIDTNDTLLVQEGVPWPHEKDPCSREMIHLLEKAESYVSWFQPTNGGVDDQFPTIRVGAKYCKLSLRLQKALFRHIRLAKGFVNREKTPDGVTKLRIPTSLFTDKKKTATRFMVIPVLIPPLPYEHPVLSDIFQHTLVLPPCCDMCPI
jgi:hypothetical protein